MGGGSWTSTAFNDYTVSTKCMSASAYARCDDIPLQTVYKKRTIDRALSPYEVMRECLDTAEHPNTRPVILALDVTGSMGSAAVEVSKKLGEIMEQVYDSGKCPDVEFCIMAIGDLVYDEAPVQISQFESDVRIAEHLDKVFFEGGGGGNNYESYTAAWYMGVSHCKLDCWSRGARGILITLGDERLNPVLRCDQIREFIGDNLQADVETEELFSEAVRKFEIHHISVKDRHSCYERNNYDEAVDKSWDLLGQNYHVSTIDNLSTLISDIVTGEVEDVSNPVTQEISW